jgi:colanic acid/amylovoran biosynthesis glycosyltransferase
MKDKILIFKNSMLEFSETFIKEQAESIEKFEIQYMCSRTCANGLPISIEKENIICKNKLERIFEILYLYGISTRRYSNRIRSISPKLVHAHFGVDASFILKPTKKLNIPLVTTFHGYDITIDEKHAKSSFLAHRLYHKNQSNLAKNGDCFIAVSDFIKDKLISNGFPEDKIVKHYIGVDTKKFGSTERKPKRNHIVFVGRLVEKKGTQDLLLAFKAVKEQLVDASLTIIGDGPLRLKLEEFVQKNQLNNVTFTGRQTQAEVKKRLATASIFCVPSKTAANGDSEAFGIVFIEAQAMGIPIVSYRHGGIPEAVSHGKTGLLAKEGDIQELSQHIIYLLKNDSLLTTFSNNAVDFVNKNYCLFKQSRKLEEIYESVILNHSRNK